MKRLNFLLVAILLLTMTSCYDFNREQDFKDAENRGKSILIEAESSKKAKIEEAKAEKESAELLGEARIIDAKAKAQETVIRAEAKAKAILIEAEAIKGQEDYLKFKAIEAMYEKGKFIYIPTEAGLPILEAGKR